MRMTQFSLHGYTYRTNDDASYIEQFISAGRWQRTSGHAIVMEAISVLVKAGIYND